MHLFISHLTPTTSIRLMTTHLMFWFYTNLKTYTRTLAFAVLKSWCGNRHQTTALP